MFQWYVLWKYHQLCEFYGQQIQSIWLLHIHYLNRYSNIKSSLTFIYSLSHVYLINLHISCESHCRVKWWWQLTDNLLNWNQSIPLLVFFFEEFLPMADLHAISIMVWSIEHIFNYLTTNIVYQGLRHFIVPTLKLNLSN